MLVIFYTKQYKVLGFQPNTGLDTKNFGKEIALSRFSKIYMEKKHALQDDFRVA